MIKIIKNGDIFDSKCQTITNAINTVGIMGAGIALAFKNRFPEMYSHYKTGCTKGLVKVGHPYIYKESPQRWILNFPTKDHYKDDSSKEFVTDGLKFIASKYKNSGIKSLALPALGCGLGNLNPQWVYDEIHEILADVEIPIDLYWDFKTNE